MYNVHLYINHRQILAFFLDIKNDWADLVCGGSGKSKNNLKQILSQESMR
jgi:hypothetical protein